MEAADVREEEALGASFLEVHVPLGLVELGNVKEENKLHHTAQEVEECCKTQDLATRTVAASPAAHRKEEDGKLQVLDRRCQIKIFVII